MSHIDSFFSKTSNRLVRVHVRACAVFLIHSSIDGHVGSFHILVIVNNDALNRSVHVYFGLVFFIFGSDRMFSRAVVAPNCRALSHCCPLGFHWWLVPAVRPDACPQPTTGAAVQLVCAVIFPSPLGRSPLAALRAHGPVMMLWMAHAEGRLAAA